MTQPPPPPPDPPPEDPEAVAFARVLIVPTDAPPAAPPQPEPPPDQPPQPAPPPPEPAPPAPEPPPPAPPPPPPPETYVVQQGDTLSGIAQKLGVSQQALQDANGIENPDQIQEGQVLKVPR